jgi:predicted SnoaL-like aldol condensation-catalyzing enzyme
VLSFQKIVRKNKISAEKNKTLIIELCTEVWHKGNLGALNGYFAEDVIFHRPLPGFESDPIEGRKFHAMQMGQAFSEGSGSMQAPFADGDYVFSQWSFSGKHAGVFMGIEPKGNQVSISGMEMFRIVNGKIVEYWHEENWFGFLSDLGCATKDQCPASNARR